MAASGGRAEGETEGIVFNDTQQLVYDSCKDMVLGKLISVLEPVNHEPSASETTSMSNNELGRHVFLFVLCITIKFDKEAVTNVVRKMYPSNDKLHELFIMSNQLFNGLLPDHPFLRSVCDVRFFTSENPAEYVKVLVHHFGESLKKDVGEWYHDHVKDKPLNRTYMNLLTFRC